MKLSALNAIATSIVVWVLIMKNIINVIEQNLGFKNLMILGVFTRLAIFTLFLFHPFPYGSDPPISALHYQTGTDLAFYLPQQYLSGDISIIGEIVSTIQNLFWTDVPVKPLPGPIFPALIWLTDYAPGKTVILSTLILLAELMAFIVWCNIFKSNFTGFVGLFFCLMPHTIWFGIIVSSDIFLYLISAIFFYFWSLDGKKPERFLFALSFIALLVRPGGLTFAISRFFFLALNRINSRKYLFLYSLLALLGLIYFLPYIIFTQTYIVEVHQKLFSITGKLSDFFEVFGFHTSRSSLSMAYFLRYFYGIIFLLGFFYVIIYDRKFKIPVFVTTASVILLLYPTWRYLLPILPILYFNGVKAVEDIFQYIFKRNYHS